ncbi:MAG TPA: hypothetical protein VMZ28_10630 [Kofleriaceae bacterium]|nr:hypothetical protein [Kofleriaceae bacterium]
MKALALLVIAASLGCSATFVDWRTDAAAQADLGAVDLAETDLSGFDLAGADLGETVLATGRFEGRAGHLGSGGGRLVETATGIEVRMDADFSASAVPGPVVVLTARPGLGTALVAEDLQLGALSSPKGAQSYPVPGGDGGRRNLFVFCKPFGVEVARAVLAP